MLEGNLCIAETKLDVLPFALNSKGLILFLFVK